jgi:gamma-glutamyltranspeptidase
LVDGIITLEDLAQYAPKIKAPLNISLDNGDFTAFAPVPPSSGVITNFMLKVLDGMDTHNHKFVHAAYLSCYKDITLVLRTLLMMRIRS